jgi:hypothetical protein
MNHNDVKLMTKEELFKNLDALNSEILRRNTLDEANAAIKSVHKMQEESSIYVETFNPGPHMANTLDPKEIGENKSGWTIDGPVYEDWFEWVNEFSAAHANGKWWVKGDFESKVEASSKEAYDDFIKNHPPLEWDYWDI